MICNRSVFCQIKVSNIIFVAWICNQGLGIIGCHFELLCPVWDTNASKSCLLGTSNISTSSLPNLSATVMLCSVVLGYAWIVDQFYLHQVFQYFSCYCILSFQPFWASNGLIFLPCRVTNFSGPSVMIPCQSDCQCTLSLIHCTAYAVSQFFGLPHLKNCVL